MSNQSYPTDHPSNSIDSVDSWAIRTCQKGSHYKKVTSQPAVILHVPEADMHMPHPLDIFLLKIPTGLFGFEGWVLSIQWTLFLGPVKGLVE